MMIGSTPALAQRAWDQPRWGHDEVWRGASQDPYQRIAFLQQRLDRAVQQGALDPAEAHRVAYRLDELRRSADNQRRRHHGYLSQNILDYINQRLDRVSQRLDRRQHLAGGYDVPRDDRWNR
jgi:hypothetical protein